MVAIRDFVQLTETIGTSGQPTAAQFRLIADAGYSHVVNLIGPGESLPEEARIVADLGMNYVYIPVPWTEPRPVHVRWFCRIMSALSPDRVFVHCAANCRVSAFMYHYLTKVVGMSAESATSPRFEQWTPEGVWADLLQWTARDIGL